MPGVVLRQGRHGVLEERGVPRRQRRRPVHAVVEPEHAFLVLAPALGEQRRVGVELLPALGAGRRRDIEGAGQPPTPPGTVPSCGQRGRDARVAGGLVRAHRTHRAPAPHRLGPALQQEQPVPTGRVGLHRPLDVLRAAVVPLRPLGEPGHLRDLLVGQARDGAPIGGHRDPRDPTPARRRPVLDVLVRDHPPGDLHEDLVDEVVVRGDLAGHHRLPEAPRRVDGDLGPVAVLRVEGEGDARDLGEHHLLDGDAHRRAGPVPASAAGMSRAR